MKPNTVVIGYFSKDKGSRADNTRDSQKNIDKIKRLIHQFPTDSAPLVDSEYVSILTDINTAGKNLLIARKYVVSVVNIPTLTSFQFWKIWCWAHQKSFWNKGQVASLWDCQRAYDVCWYAVIGLAYTLWF